MSHAMDRSPPSPPRGRIPKRVRSTGELAELARQLGADWQSGDSVMTWIRRHEATTHELSRLVRDGWSWSDLGRALDLAGIHYQTGGAMPGDLLRRKAGKARSDEWRRQAGERLRQGVASASQTALPQTVQTSPPATDRRPPLAPAMPPVLKEETTPPEEVAPDLQFRPASLKNWSGTRIVKDKAPEPTPPPAQSPSEDVDEVIARLFGRK